MICKVSISEGIESLSPKVSQDVYYPGKSCWVHEPVFVPRPNAKVQWCLTRYCAGSSVSCWAGTRMQTAVFTIDMHSAWPAIQELNI